MESVHCGTVHLQLLQLRLSGITPGSKLQPHPLLPLTKTRFATYNYLDDHLALPHNLPQKLLRQAFMGFVASAISDTISNSL
jgi:hypothetical protein